MGKRARAAHRAASQTSSRSSASTAASRQQHDQSVDARMDAITAQSKYSQPRVTRVPPAGRGAKAGKAARRRPAPDVDEEAPQDEIDHFHRQRDFIPLDSRRDDEDVDEDEEELANSRVLDLPDGADEEAEEGEEGEEVEAAEDGAVDAFAPLPLDDLLGEDDQQRRERSLAAERRLTTSWGRNRRLYYSADTVDWELESDEDVARAEEEEATRMAQETLQQRLPSDYTLGELLLVNKAHTAPPAPALSAVSLVGEDVDGDEGEVERVERLDGLSEEEKMELLVSRSPEVLGLLEDVKAQVAEANSWRRKVGAAKGEEAKEWMRTVDTVLSMYCSCALVFLAMKGEGGQMQTHPINQQLLALRGQLTRLMALKQRFDPAASPTSAAAFTTAEAKEQPAAKKQPTLGATAQTNGTKRRTAAEEDDAEEASDDSDEVDDDDGFDDEEAEEEEVKEERKAAPRKDIFSAINLLKATSKAAPKAGRAAVPPPAGKSSLSHFDALDDYGDLPAVPLPKRQKPNPTLRPTPAPSRTLDPDNFDSDDDDGLLPDDDPEARALYDRLAQQRGAKQLQRPSAPDGPVPDLSHDVVEGKRRIGRLIEKNEGLKPSRPRDRKTPKTRNRARYEKALVKRRSQVREYQGQGGVYGGEATGIKRNVAKSVRIKG